MDAEEIRIRLMMAEENRDSYRKALDGLPSLTQEGLNAIKVQLYCARAAHWEQRVKDLTYMLAAL